MRRRGLSDGLDGLNGRCFLYLASGFSLSHFLLRHPLRSVSLPNPPTLIWGGALMYDSLHKSNAVSKGADRSLRAFHQCIRDDSVRRYWSAEG